jgi:hypothetical protein
LLYGLSPIAAYGIASIMLAIATVCTFSIPKPAQHTLSEKRSLQTLTAGFRYIWKEKVVLGAISLDLFAVLLGGVGGAPPSLCARYSAGMLRAAPGIGAILTAVWLTGHPIRDHADLIMFAFVALFGLLTIMFGLSNIAWLSIVVLALMGAADMVSVYIRETLLQLWTPDHVRGRVNAVNMVFVGASNELGEFRAGIMASLIGTVPAVVFGGLAVASLWAYWFSEAARST